MKGLTAAAMLLVLTVVAGAKPAPVSDPKLAAYPTSPLARNDVDINIGPAGAMLEREYFQAPQPPFTAGGLPCRLQSAIFDKMQLARLCR
jgi:hypothetical protein